MGRRIGSSGEPPLLLGISISSPDEVVAVSSPSPPGDHRQFQKLFKRVAEVPPSGGSSVSSHKLLDILQIVGWSRVVLSVNEAILEDAKLV